MKKILLSFLSLTGLGFSAFAQSHINIELLSATYTTPAVQFRVSWDAIPVVNGETHNSKIWLWVDFRKIENNQPSGTWTRATVDSPSPGTVAPETDKGFWLQGNSGSYSQIVTVALPDIPANTKFNWCAYASDCPPNVTLDEGTYTFKGTTNFIVSEPARTLTTGTIAKSDLTVTSSSTFTDATDCPGIGSLYCPYTGSDLYMDATHLCQQRASGAQNWEAWIKDTRDNQVYRITQFSDNSWWFADDFNIDQNVYVVCDGRRYYMPNAKPDAPTGWSLPTRAQANARWAGVTTSDIYGGPLVPGALPVNKNCENKKGVVCGLITTDCSGLGWDVTCDGSYRSCHGSTNQPQRIRYRRVL